MAGRHVAVADESGVDSFDDERRRPALARQRLDDRSSGRGPDAHGRSCKPPQHAFVNTIPRHGIDGGEVVLARQHVWKTESVRLPHEGQTGCLVSAVTVAPGTALPTSSITVPRHA
jgi:hypothetical protein